MRLPLPPGASRIALGVALVALLVGPPFVSSFLLALLTQAVIYAVLAMSLDVILGYIGLASLGHAADLAGDGGRLHLRPPGPARHRRLLPDDHARPRHGGLGAGASLGDDDPG
jgi:hypothetical protein